MRPATILKSTNGGPVREVPFDESRLAALLCVNASQFRDAGALMRHLRRGRPVYMILSEYRLKPEDQIRIAA